MYETDIIAWGIVLGALSIVAGLNYAHHRRLKHVCWTYGHLWVSAGAQHRLKCGRCGQEV
jgi:hypothetical protein